MSKTTPFTRLTAAATIFLAAFSHAAAQQSATPDMVFNLSGLGKAHALFDGNPATVFEPRHQAGFTATPAEVVVWMNPQQGSAPCQLTKIRFVAAPGATGTIRVFEGEPGNWHPFNPAPQPFGNGTSALEWHPVIGSLKFLKFVFEKPNELLPQNFQTGEITLTTSGDCFFTDDPTPVVQTPGALPFDERMGVNNFVGKSQLYYQTAPFANVREYLPWDHIQGHLSGGNTSTEGENQPFHFAPSFPGYDLDRHFGNLADYGRSVLGTFKESSPFQTSFNYQPGDNAQTMNELGLDYNALGQAYLDLMERKPGRPSAGVAPNNPQFSEPKTYEDHALAVGQVALRYGRGGSPDKARFGDASKVNQGFLNFIENWNEQDKWWLQPATGGPVKPNFEQRLAFFTPLEYMAMTHADHFAHGQPALPMVMSGLTEFDAEWFRGAFMAWWELTGEQPTTANFPFEAINFHHYSVENWQRGLMPEADPELQAGNPHSNLDRIRIFRDKYLSGKPIWVTEFGYSDHPDDATAARPHYPNPDMEEVQAQWLVRSFLIFNRLGVDRAFAYQLTDDGPNQWHGYFNHTGMVDVAHHNGWVPTFRYKKSWYYLYTLRNVLQHQFFKKSEIASTLGGRPLEVYFFENQDFTEKTRVVWVPQDVNPGFEKYDLPVAPGASVRLVELTHESITGLETQLADSDHDGFIRLDRVGERPLLVLEGATPPPLTSCNCSTPLTLLDGSANNLQKLTAETGQILADKHPRCEYGARASEFWQGPAASVTLNLGGGDPADEWLVEGIYLQDPAGQEGELIIELLEKNGTPISTFGYRLDGQPMYPFNATGYDYVWKRFENIQLRAAAIRIFKNDGAALGELVVCARPLTACVSDGAAPPKPALTMVEVNGNSLNVSWLPVSLSDVAGFSGQLFDSVGTPVSDLKTVFEQQISFDLSAFVCGKKMEIRVSALDCEGFWSAPARGFFSTTACSSTPPPPPPPTPGNPTDCECKPTPVTLADAWYELANGQTLPTGALTGEACADAAPDKLPLRMMDEQHLLGAPCQSGYELDGVTPDFYVCGQGSADFPVQEWFPGWPGGAATYPFRAVLHFPEALTFNGLYLYDSYDKGKLSIEYRESEDAPWRSLPMPDGKSYLTDAWHKWVLVFHQNMPLAASDLRVTMKDEHARFAELALCVDPSVRRSRAGAAVSRGPASDFRTEEIFSKNIDFQSVERTGGAAGEPLVFPNPSSGQVFVQPNGLHFSKILLTDLSGRVVREMVAAEGQASYALDLRELAQGMYLLAFFDGEKTVWRTRVARQ